MLTYTARKRVLRIEKELEFPNDVEMCFQFEADSAFGDHAAGRTIRQNSTNVSLTYNSNTGRWYIPPLASIDSLSFNAEYKNAKLRVDGPRISVQLRCESLSELSDYVASIYYVFPFVLSLHLDDALIITRVDGLVGDEPFRWELAQCQAPSVIASRASQERKFVEAWESLSLLGELRNRRVETGLRYFHTAIRLRKLGNTPWEFMSEVILNLHKCLDVLFPARGKVKPREAARKGLLQLGYSEYEIEAFFVPVMLLRDNIDSGHVFLNLFTPAELGNLHAFTEQMEKRWHGMLLRILEKLRVDPTVIEDHKPVPASSEDKRLLSRIAKTVAEENRRTNTQA